MSGSEALSLERAAAVIGVRPATLAAWAAEGRGPVPYRQNEAGVAVAWTAFGIQRWKARLRPETGRGHFDRRQQQGAL